MQTMLLSLLALAFPPLAFAGDWPGWRGPQRDGSATRFTAPAAWPETLKESWRLVIGEGHSSPVVAGDRVFLFSREGEEEVVRCVTLDGGKEVWRRSYAAPYKMDDAAVAHGKGPKATPAAGSGAVFTLGISGILSAFDAGTGEVKWRREFAKEYPATSPLYGAAASPLLADGLLIAAVGGHGKGALAAFDPGTGEGKWRWEGDGPSYASPMLFTLAGKRQVVTQSQEHLAGVDAADGKLLWKVPFSTPYHQNIVTPVLSEDLAIFSGLDQGTVAYRLEAAAGEMVPREAWKNAELPMYMNSPVLAGGRLYGLTHRQNGRLFALDPRSGKTLWQGDPRFAENASIVHAGGLLLVLTTEGELHVFAPREDGSLDRLRKHKVAESPVWAHLAVAGGRLLVKDRTAVRVFSIEG